METPEPKPANGKGESCGNCHYYRNTYCRRNPPQVFQGGHFPTSCNQPIPNLNGVAWCGEWRPVGFVEEWRKKQK